MQNTHQLNKQFAIESALTFSDGPEGTVMIHIHTAEATAQISTYGAQVLSFVPAGSQQDLFFLSPQSAFGHGKAIRGGVPICWPWFGDDPKWQGRPSHGFARNQTWQVIDTACLPDNTVRITLQLQPNEVTVQYWPYDFNLQLTITVGKTLKMELTTENRDQHEVIITQALHAYFSVGNIHQTQVLGLAEHQYLDKTDQFSEKFQKGDITFQTETDRIYLNTPKQVLIEDLPLSRRVAIRSEGSKTVVVWNPWEKANDLADMPSQAYESFVCVETANAVDDRVTLAPGERYTLTAEYQLNYI